MGVLALAQGDPPDFDPSSVRFRRASFSSAEVGITDTTWLLRPHLADKLVIPEEGITTEVVERKEEEAQRPRGTSTIGVEPELSHREVHIEIDGWENWNDLLRYVIRPLSDQGAAPRVHITIDAASASGIPDRLLRDQIEVSLQQLGLRYRMETDFS
jgi:hypothetical protein